jgi:DNA-binding CsgD family transcriptional regulator
MYTLSTTTSRTLAAGQPMRERPLPWRLQLTEFSTDEEVQPAQNVATRSIDHLTASELQALACAANGLTACEAGHKVFKGSETIKTHLGVARLKLGARNTTHAVTIAMQRHLLEPSANRGRAA